MTFIVRDLAAMDNILVSVLGAKRVYDSGDDSYSLSPEKFYVVGSAAHHAPLWIATMQGDSLPSRTYNHIAFKITEADIEPCLKAITALGLEIKEGRPRIPGEAYSIYFYDHDNHLFELHTGTLEDRLKAYDQKPS